MQAAQEAGHIAMRHFGHNPQTWDKGDGAGPVTQADLDVNAYLAANLRSARPDYGWLSEESDDSSDRLTRESCFVIDPIDGTRAFIEGSRDWAISLAIVTDGVPIAAAIYLPAKDTLYSACRGNGAKRDGTPLQVSDQTDLSQAMVLASRPNLQGRHWKTGTAPSFKTSFRSSLAYRLALVAEGRFDAMLTLRPTWEWDIAAGALIVSEALGTITDRVAAPLRFNTPLAQLDGVVAAGPIHPELTNALA